MRFIPLLIIVCFIPLMAMADSAPVPSSHPLKDIEKKLETEKQRKADLQKQMKGIRTELSGTKKELVSIAGEIKENEVSLSRLETRIQDMQAEQKEIEQRLIEDKGSIGDLILALQRMGRVPTEAVLVRPGAPLETAQSAMLLESILPRLYGRANSLKDDLNRLQDLITSLENDREAAENVARSLKVKHMSMATLIKKREGLYAQTQEDIQRQQQNIERISSKAADLKDLVKKLEESEKIKQQQANNVRAAVYTPPSGTSQARLPASGVIRVGFNQRDEIGAESQGLKIETRPGGLVVAPMNGQIRYAGNFRNYGQMVIIEHDDGYHSLVAGLDRIDTVVGRYISAGEPVGLMSRSGNNSNPVLYYELRYKGQPVNPARKFAGLG